MLDKDWEQACVFREVIDLAASLFPIIALYLIFEGITVRPQRVLFRFSFCFFDPDWLDLCCPQATSNGVLRGCGRQYIGAGVIFFAYLFVALPVGISLMFLTPLRLQGTLSREKNTFTFHSLLNAQLECCPLCFPKFSRILLFLQDCGSAWPRQCSQFAGSTSFFSRELTGNRKPRKLGNASSTSPQSLPESTQMMYWTILQTVVKTKRLVSCLDFPVKKGKKEGEMSLCFLYSCSVQRSLYMAQCGKLRNPLASFILRFSLCIQHCWAKNSTPASTVKDQRDRAQWWSLHGSLRACIPTLTSRRRMSSTQQMRETPSLTFHSTNSFCVEFCYSLWCWLLFCWVCYVDCTSQLRAIASQERWWIVQTAPQWQHRQTSQRLACTCNHKRFQLSRCNLLFNCYFPKWDEK